MTLEALHKKIVEDMVRWSEKGASVPKMAKTLKVSTSTVRRMLIKFDRYEDVRENIRGSRQAKHGKF